MKHILSYCGLFGWCMVIIPDSKVHGAHMGPIRADRTQVDPMWAPWTLLSGIQINGILYLFVKHYEGHPHLITSFSMVTALRLIGLKEREKITYWLWCLLMAIDLRRQHINTQPSDQVTAGYDRDHRFIVVHVLAFWKNISDIYLPCGLLRLAMY